MPVTRITAYLGAKSPKGKLKITYHPDMSAIKNIYKHYVHSGIILRDISMRTLAANSAW